MTGSDSQAWVMLRIGRSAVQSHKRKEPVNEESKVCRFGCPSETIAIAIAEQDGEVRSLGVIPNREDSVRKLVRKLGTMEELRFCYEAGPTGYVLYWQLTRMGAKCEVVAPTLVPVNAGDRVKTDRRDALKLREIIGPES
jgi:hypothetical protein